MTGLSIKPGDRLWVRETWARVYQDGEPHDQDSPFIIEYRADTENPYPGHYPKEIKHDPDCGRWHSSTAMPRWASRITLQVPPDPKAVRIHRLQEITEDEAVAEGLHREGTDVGKIFWFDSPADWSKDFRDQFRDLWDTRHGPGAWERNDWVGRLAFTRRVP